MDLAPEEAPMVPPTCCWSALLLYREALGTKYKGYTPAELRLPLGCAAHPRPTEARRGPE